MAMKQVSSESNVLLKDIDKESFDSCFENLEKVELMKTLRENIERKIENEKTRERCMQILAKAEDRVN